MAKPILRISPPLVSWIKKVAIVSKRIKMWTKLLFFTVTSTSFVVKSVVVSIFVKIVKAERLEFKTKLTKYIIKNLRQIGKQKSLYFALLKVKLRLQLN
ncbi:hypothetical protein SCLARK_001841 [Spiroplasma clarkii]|nr:hypothetical protein SCLARK_001841 [Spiroplasma clarkii]